MGVATKPVALDTWQESLPVFLFANLSFLFLLCDSAHRGRLHLSGCWLFCLVIDCNSVFQDKEDTLSFCSRGSHEKAPITSLTSGSIINPRTHCCALNPALRSCCLCSFHSPPPPQPITSVAGILRQAAS